MNILNQVLSRILIVCFNQISILIALIFLATNLNIKIFSIIASGFIIVQLGWFIGNWGNYNYSVEILNKKLKNDRNSLITHLLCISLILSLIYCLFVYIFIETGLINFPVNSFIYLLFPIFFGSIFPLWFFQIVKKPHDLIFITFCSRIVYLLIIILMINNKNIINLVFIAQGISFFMVTIYAFYLMRIKYQFNLENISTKLIYIHLKKSFPFFINTFTNNQIFSLWGFALVLYGGQVQISLYSIAENIFKAGGAFSEVIAQVMRANFIDKNFYESKSVFLYLMIVYFLVSLFAILIIEDLIVLFFPTTFYDSIIISKLMIVFLAFYSSIKLINYSALGLIKSVEWVNRKTIYFLLIHFLMLSVWSINFESAYSLVLFFGLTIFLQFLFLFTFFFKKND